MKALTSLNLTKPAFVASLWLTAIAFSTPAQATDDAHGEKTKNKDADKQQIDNPVPQESLGILTIESSVTEPPETQRLADELAKLKDKNRELRSRILAIQDRQASRVKDVCQLEVDFATQNSNQKGMPPLSVVELQASLNDIEIVHYLNPPMLERDTQLPLFIGPIPAGTYKLRVKGVIGVLQHDWPFAMAQGRWNIDKTFTLKLDDSGKRQIATISARPGDLEPSLALTERSEAKR